LLQMLIKKAKNGDVPNPPQNDSTTDAEYMRPSDGSLAAARTYIRLEAA